VSLPPAPSTAAPGAGSDTDTEPADWRTLGFDGPAAPGGTSRQRQGEADVTALPGDPRVLQGIIDDFTYLRDTAWTVSQGLVANLNLATSAGFEGKTADALRDVIAGRLKSFIVNIARSFSLAGDAVAEYRLALTEGQRAVAGMLLQAQGLKAGDPRLAGLKQQVDDQVQQVNDAAQTMERALRDAADMVSQPIKVPSLGARIWHGLELALNITAMVLALLSVVVDGPLGIAVFAAGAASLGMTAYDYAKGETNLKGLLLSALGVLLPDMRGFFSMAALGRGARALVGGAGRAAGKAAQALRTPEKFPGLLRRGAWAVGWGLVRVPVFAWHLGSALVVAGWRGLLHLPETVAEDFARTVGEAERYPKLAAALGPHTAYVLVNIGRIGGALLTPLVFHDMAEFGFRGAWQAMLKRASLTGAVRDFRAGWSGYRSLAEAGELADRLHEAWAGGSHTPDGGSHAPGVHLAEPPLPPVGGGPVFGFPVGDRPVMGVPVVGGMRVDRMFAVLEKLPAEQFGALQAWAGQIMRPLMDFKPALGTDAAAQTLRAEQLGLLAPVMYALREQAPVAARVLREHGPTEAAPVLKDLTPVTAQVMAHAIAEEYRGGVLPTGLLGGMPEPHVPGETSGEASGSGTKTLWLPESARTGEVREHSPLVPALPHEPTLLQQYLEAEAQVGGVIRTNSGLAVLVKDVFSEEAQQAAQHLAEKGLPPAGMEPVSLSGGPDPLLNDLRVTITHPEATAGAPSGRVLALDGDPALARWFTPVELPESLAARDQLIGGFTLIYNHGTDRFPADTRLHFGPHGPGAQAPIVDLPLDPGLYLSYFHLEPGVGHDVEPELVNAHGDLVDADGELRVLPQDATRVSIGLKGNRGLWETMIVSLGTGDVTTHTLPIERYEIWSVDYTASTAKRLLIGDNPGVVPRAVETAAVRLLPGNTLQLLSNDGIELYTHHVMDVARRTLMRHVPHSVADPAPAPEPVDATESVESAESGSSYLDEIGEERAAPRSLTLAEIAARSEQARQPVPVAAAPPAAAASPYSLLLVQFGSEDGAVNEVAKRLGVGPSQVVECLIGNSPLDGIVAKLEELAIAGRPFLQEAADRGLELLYGDYGKLLALFKQETHDSAVRGELRLRPGRPGRGAGGVPVSRIAKTLGEKLGVTEAMVKSCWLHRWPEKGQTFSRHLESATAVGVALLRPLGGGFGEVLHGATVWAMRQNGVDRGLQILGDSRLSVEPLPDGLTDRLGGGFSVLVTGDAGRLPAGTRLHYGLDTDTPPLIVLPSGHRASAVTELGAVRAPAAVPHGTDAAGAAGADVPRGQQRADVTSGSSHASTAGSEGSQLEVPQGSKRPRSGKRLRRGTRLESGGLASSQLGVRHTDVFKPTGERAIGESTRELPAVQVAEGTPPVVPFPGHEAGALSVGGERGEARSPASHAVSTVAAHSEAMSTETITPGTVHVPDGVPRDVELPADAHDVGGEVPASPAVQPEDHDVVRMLVETAGVGPEAIDRASQMAWSAAASEAAEDLAVSPHAVTPFPEPLPEPSPERLTPREPTGFRPEGADIPAPPPPSGTGLPDETVPPGQPPHRTVLPPGGQETAQVLLRFFVRMHEKTKQMQELLRISQPTLWQRVHGIFGFSPESARQLAEAIDGARWVPTGQRFVDIGAGERLYLETSGRLDFRTLQLPGTDWLLRSGRNRFQLVDRDLQPVTDVPEGALTSTRNGVTFRLTVSGTHEPAVWHVDNFGVLRWREVPVTGPGVKPGVLRVRISYKYPLESLGEVVLSHEVLTRTGKARQPFAPSALFKAGPLPEGPAGQHLDGIALVVTRGDDEVLTRLDSMGRVLLHDGSEAPAVVSRASGELPVPDAAGGSEPMETDASHAVSTVAAHSEAMSTETITPGTVHVPDGVPRDVELPADAHDVGGEVPASPAVQPEDHDVVRMLVETAGVGSEAIDRASQMAWSAAASEAAEDLAVSPHAVTPSPEPLPEPSPERLTPREPTGFRPEGAAGVETFTAPGPQLMDIDASGHPAGEDAVTRLVGSSTPLFPVVRPVASSAPPVFATRLAGEGLPQPLRSMLLVSRSHDPSSAADGLPELMGLPGVPDEEVRQFMFSPVSGALAQRLPGGLVIVHTVTGVRYIFRSDRVLAYREVPFPYELLAPYDGWVDGWVRVRVDVLDPHRLPEVVEELRPGGSAGWLPHQWRTQRRTDGLLEVRTGGAAPLSGDRLVIDPGTGRLHKHVVDASDGGIFDRGVWEIDYATESAAYFDVSLDGGAPHLKPTGKTAKLRLENGMLRLEEPHTGLRLLARRPTEAGLQEMRRLLPSPVGTPAEMRAGQHTEAVQPEPAGPSAPSAPPAAGVAGRLVPPVLTVPLGANLPHLQVGCLRLYPADSGRAPELVDMAGRPNTRWRVQWFDGEQVQLVPLAGRGPEQREIMEIGVVSGDVLKMTVPAWQRGYYWQIDFTKERGILINEAGESRGVPVPLRELPDGTYELVNRSGTVVFTYGEQGN
jgi:hypothetical protein